MSAKEKATAYHLRGFNCAQSVLCSCGAYTGLEEENALALSAGFGGGLRCGEVCGAVSGGVMAVGLCCRYTDEHDLQTKEHIAALSRELTGRFRERFGALRCEEIMGDKSRCPEYIEYMAALTEQTIQKIKKQEST